MKKVISIVGDRNVDKGSRKWTLSYNIGKKLIDEGYSIMTGGLGSLAEAVYAGALASEKHYDGSVIAILPGFDPSAAERSADIGIATGLDEHRNLIVANSDAVIAIGGGAGTLSELAYAWALKRLVICLDVEGWSGELSGKRLDRRVRYPNILEDQCFPARDVGDVVRILSEYSHRYDRRHSGIPPS